MATTIGQLAGWDGAELRAAVSRLAGVAEQLLAWRPRLDALGRQLGSAQCWSGPAGTVAAAAVLELSGVASGMSGALAESLAHLQRLTGAAVDAQEQAVAALGAAASAGVTLDDAGQPVDLPPPPGPLLGPQEVADVLATRSAGQLAATQAAEALAAAAAAMGEAIAAQDPLSRLGVLGGGPVGFDDLAVRLGVTGPVGAPVVPSLRGPGDAAGWWAGLTAGEQLAEIAARPALVGALDGVPAWARDQANRAQLAAALRDLPADGTQRAMAEAVSGRLAAEADAGRTAQLLQFDPAGDLAAVSVGDLDTAAAVGVLVPGVTTTPADDLDTVLADAADVASAAEAAAPGLAVATVAWLGYRTPGLITALVPSAAVRGGPALDATLDGLAAARAVPGAAPAPRTTVLAHSYGTLVAAQAARAPGELAADAVVLLGSPGTGMLTAADLEADEVYGAWSPGDPISTSRWYGPGPIDPFFGDTPLPTEISQEHSEYYDQDRPTLAAIGEVVAGVRDH